MLNRAQCFENLMHKKQQTMIEHRGWGLVKIKKDYSKMLMRPINLENDVLEVLISYIYRGDIEWLNGLTFVFIIGLKQRSLLII